jgi:hypothetical protein
VVLPAMALFATRSSPKACKSILSGCMTRETDNYNLAVILSYSHLYPYTHFCSPAVLDFALSRPLYSNSASTSSVIQLYRVADPRARYNNYLNEFGHSENATDIPDTF